MSAIRKGAANAYADAAAVEMLLKAYLQVSVPATELAAGTAIEFVAPFDGYITRLRTVVQTAIVTGGDLTVEINGGSAITALTTTIADSATKGTRSVKSAVNASTNLVKAGDRITVTPAAAFNGGGAVSGILEITPV